MMRRLARAVERPVRWFFATTGLPVPDVARRARRSLVGAEPAERRSLPDEVDALHQRVDRLEARAYLDDLGHPRD